jgi:DNA-binding Lrp family transcriptional regulator
MDEIDEALLALLKENARLPVASLAQTLGLARSTVQSRLERLERRGIVVGYTVRLCEEATKSTIHATALLQIEPRELPSILSRLRAVREVTKVHTTSGRFDLLVRLAAPTTRALDAALDSIGSAPGVKSSESLVHLSTRIDRAV